MKSPASGFRGALLVSGVLAVLCWSPAFAADDGFDLQLFSPNLFGGNFISLEDARTLPQLGFGFGLYYDYSTSLLTFYQDDKAEFDAIGAVNALHLNAALGIMDWWNVGVQVPAVSLRHREDLNLADLDNRGELKDSGLVIGDLLAEMKFRALKQEAHWLGLSISPFGRFPTGDSDRYAGEGRLTAGGLLALDHDFGVMTVALNGGYLYRGRAGELFGVEVGDAILYGAGVSKVFDFGLGIGVEYRGRAYQVEDSEKVFGSPMELALFLQYKFGAKGPRVVAGGGAGLTDGVGAPPYRVIGGIDYFRLPSTLGVLIVRTRDEQGLPLAAELTIVGPEGRRLVVQSEGDHQNELPPGAYTVTASGGARPTASQRIELKRGQTAEVTLSLPKPKEIETIALLRAIDKCSGAPIKATLALDDGARIELGEQALRQALTPGAHRGSLSAAGYPTRQVEFRLEKGQAKRVDLALSRPNRVAKKGRISFAENSSDVPAAAYPILDDLAQQILQLCDFKTVVIEGHADDSEGKAQGQKLSEERARAVVKHLVGKGVNPAKLTAVGFGATRPVASNAMAWGREQNRRIEIRLEE